MKQYDLGKENITKLLFSFAIPCIISMLINSVYNIVDQIFIGQGVGTIGNAATNVIFPVVLICSSVAQLIGNGCAANYSLRLGEGNIESARKSTGSSISLLIVVALVVAILGELFLPVLIQWFGCTASVYDSAMVYGRIILLGAPFMIIYTGLSSIIRSDGSPKYSMICLLVGAILNLIFDPIFIFGFDMGVAGGAWATILGQVVSCIVALAYLKKFKAITLKAQDFRINKSVFKTMGLGLSSFITNMTILALFVVMNNLMTRYGAESEFGSDIPLSVYGVLSKLNSLYVSSILGISIGAQPIIGFNYGAKNYARVKETLKKVVLVSFGIGIFFNLLFQVFPEPIISIFITKSDPNYDLFMKFAIDCSRIFLMVCCLNSFEMCSSIVIQSLGNVKKATMVSFTRQIFLFIPLAFLFSHFIGLYGALYAGPVADGICFVIVIFLFKSEYRKLDGAKTVYEQKDEQMQSVVQGQAKTSYVITIAREYGSGGRYVGQLLAKELNVPCYDKEFVFLTAKESGFDEAYVAEMEEKKELYYGNDDLLFATQAKIIKEIGKHPCVIVGRCADFILKNQKNVLNVFLYSDEKSKENRVVLYYGVARKDAKKVVAKKNKERETYYRYHTDSKWNSYQNYDFALNVDTLGIEKTVQVLKEAVDLFGQQEENR